MVLSPSRPGQRAADGPVGYTSSSYEALEFSFAFWCHDRALGRALASILAPLRSDKPPSHRYAVTPVAEDKDPPGYELSLDGAVVATVAHADAAAAWLLWHVNGATVRAGRRHVMVHAGGVSAGGIGIVLPAPMGSGKTTLVAGLVQRGLEYLSDEVVAIRHHEHLLVPFPKALAVKPGSEAVLFGTHRRPPGARLPDGVESSGTDVESSGTDVQWPGTDGGARGVPVVVDGRRALHVVPDALRQGAVARPCRARMIVVPHYSAEGRTALVPITSGDALVALVVNTVNLDLHGARGMRVLAETARRCLCFQLEMSDLDDACRLILDAVAAAGVLATPVAGAATPIDTGPGRPPAAGGAS